MHRQQLCRSDAKHKKELKCTINIPCSSELTLCTLVVQFIHGKEIHWNGISQCCWNEEGFADFQLQTPTRNCNGKFVPAFHLTMTWEGKTMIKHVVSSSKFFYFPPVLFDIHRALSSFKPPHTTCKLPLLISWVQLGNINNCSFLAPGQGVWRHWNSFIKRH